MLETARHFLTTARQNAGDGRVLDEERARLFEATEGLLQPEIFRGQNQCEMFVLMTILGRRGDVFQRCDAVRLGPAALRRADRRRGVAPHRARGGAAFFRLGSNGCRTNAIFSNTDEHPVVDRNPAFTQTTLLDKSDFSQLCAFWSLPCPSNSFAIV